MQNTKKNENYLNNYYKKLEKLMVVVVDKSNWMKIGVVLLVVVLFSLVFFFFLLPKQVEKQYSRLLESEGGTEDVILGGMPDPSAVYCQELGYTFEIREGEKGQYGVCVFPDGSFANTWPFYYGMVKPEFSYCAIKGYEMRIDEDCSIPPCNSCVLPSGESVHPFVLMLRENPKKEELQVFYDAFGLNEG